MPDIFASIAGFVPRNVCPGCGGTFRHRLKCELKVLSIEEADILGLEEAQKIAAERRKG
jgi:hypothetical protein